MTKIILLLLTAIVLTGCKSDLSSEQKEYLASIEKIRADKDDYLKNDPSSPFNQDENAHLAPLKYYDINFDLVFKSKLVQYDYKDTVTVFGTKGEERKAVRFGYVTINYNNKSYNVNVYEGISRSGVKYYSIWFTDLTTGEETYGVGRYLDFELNPDPDFIYDIDFNLAYNPYCAYSSKYSCAIPLKEDHIPLKITAGEKNFHN